MANNKQRYINTRLWNDGYVSGLDPIEKLLFIYILTNEHTNISGIYELPFKIMAVETGIDESMFKKILPRLRDKVKYINGFIIIKNFIKHQETGSPNVKTGILNCLKDLDQNFLKDVVNKGYYILPTYYSDTLSIPYVEGRNYLDSNSNSNSNSDSIDTSIIEKKEKSKVVIELPIWLNKNAWNAWEQHRKEKKKSLTPTSMKLQIKFLEANKEDHVQIIKNSITNGWTGLFPIKKDFKKVPPRFIEQSTTKEDNDRRNFLSKQSEQLANNFKV